MVYDLEAHTLEISRYYSISSHEKYQRISYDEALHLFQKHFERSISWRLRSDVRVGTCLSGGLDSSFIALKASEQFTNTLPFCAFTAASIDAPFSDEPYAKKVADALKLDINGAVLRGIDGTAAEIGHICVEPFGAPCGCGSRGCVEQYSSATAIVRLKKELEPQYPSSALVNKPKLTSADVYEAGVAGDELALEVFRQMGFYLGIALADLVNVLNPEVIVIGGGAAAGWDLFIHHVEDQIKARAFREPAERVKLVRAMLGDDAGILGAARLAFDRLSENV